MKDILYCGDTAIHAQASYLAGVMTHSGFSYDYLSSSCEFNTSGDRPKLLILSDYPSKNISCAQLKEIITWVREGMSLWMIGGWDSFHGLNGDYNNALAEVLPVIVSAEDDRLNSFQPIAMVPETEHEILSSLPWQQCPTVGGLNKVEAKSDSTVLLSAIALILDNDGAGITLRESTRYPLLVSNTCHKGKTLAFMSDVAPHWTGGLVDWGSMRMTIKAPQSKEIEIGDCYIKFLTRCINWLLNTANDSDRASDFSNLPPSHAVSTS